MAKTPQPSVYFAKTSWTKTKAPKKIPQEIILGKPNISTNKLTNIFLGDQDIVNGH